MTITCNANRPPFQSNKIKDKKKAAATTTTTTEEKKNCSVYLFKCYATQSKWVSLIVYIYFISVLFVIPTILCTLCHATPHHATPSMNRADRTIDISLCFFSSSHCCCKVHGFTFCVVNVKHCSHYTVYYYAIIYLVN